MTRSFTSMLLVLQSLAAAYGEGGNAGGAVPAISATLASKIHEFSERIEGFVAGAVLRTTCSWRKDRFLRSGAKRG